MGRHTDRAVSGSRRAMVLTLTASVLLVAGGVAILRSAGDLHVGPGKRPTPSPTRSVSTTTTTPPPSTPAVAG